jgi:hypothetical protein
MTRSSLRAIMASERLQKWVDGFSGMEEFWER